MSVDVGGTFTDFVLFDIDSGTIAAFHKVLTDSERPARAVVAGWREILDMAGASSRQVDFAVHSTTIVTNAIVERRGVKTALLTTRGFRDVLEIGIEQIYDIYDLFAPYPEPLIPRELRREVDERVTRDGDVVQPLNEAAVRELVHELADEGVQSIAVSLIHAYRNPEHERRIGQVIQETHPEITVSLSSRVAPLIGEYERTSTTAADAYVKPLLRRYVVDLMEQLRGLGFERDLYMMLSSGGIATAEAASEYPIRLLESGPAAGAFAASYYGRLTGHEHVLSLDMGGTTAKACLIERGIPGVAHMLEADRVHRFKPGSGLPIMAPTIDLIEIGAGGGSIAHLNELGLLNVGPQSAESNPGPACYGLGGELPTVTDANVVLGYLDPDYFLGGRMSLQPEKARVAVEKHVGQRLHIDLLDGASGIHSIVNENMAQAARTHMIERNRDPRDAAIVAFGGAGPAHAVEVARILGVTRVIVPFGAGVASAIGALTAPMALPFARSYMTLLHACDWDTVRGLYNEMRQEAEHAFTAIGNGDGVRYRMAADMRFAGQYHELRIDLPDDADNAGAAGAVETAFRAGYTEVYGRAPSNLTPEVLNWHLIAELPRSAFQLAGDEQRERDHTTALKGKRPVFFTAPERGFLDTPVYDRYRLEPGAAFAGPCIIEEQEATIVVPPGCEVTVDGYRNVIITLNGKE
jgi:N-methylhydantoinase A/oxoprolinase/acetone carboxylase beta subunit